MEILTPATADRAAIPGSPRSAGSEATAAGSRYVRRRKESHMAAAIPEFGRPALGVAHVLRPGGYAVIFSDNGDVAAVSTPLGFALPGGGQQDGEPPEAAAV